MRRDPLRDAVEKLRRDFPGKSHSWIKRALLRLGDVREVRDGLYLVEGRRELGDWKPLYQVWFSNADRRWYCSCYLTQFGLRRRRDICTHVAAVLLFRRYKKALERVQHRRVYIAEAEVERRQKIAANGELYLKPVRSLPLFASPRYRVFVISEERRIVIKCGGYVVAEAEGEEVPLATAKFLAESYES
ncbi:hypothetical protein [Pyrobaculum ferrireducens]|uniref:SWIM-type domain-containing protein n=1 Tax=Pyrobaculum ferrireducens TaxID=1104324 RepID=G7VFW7_9CREN|nr:hypothetical protein [Pyrobaculum ferrireducens]AET31774.1 hypothetical protein P186_0319 [Pyrobaculum ferrireducens]